MTEYEVAWRLYEELRRVESPTNKEQILALFRECLAAVRGKAE